MGENGTNAIITNVVCTLVNGSDCELTLTLRDCCGNGQKYDEEVGGTSTVLTFRKENLHNGYNAAHSGACDTDNV